MRVMPPTSSTSFTSLDWTPAHTNKCMHGPWARDVHTHGQGTHACSGPCAMGERCEGRSTRHKPAPWLGETAGRGGRAASTRAQSALGNPCQHTRSGRLKLQAAERRVYPYTVPLFTLGSWKVKRGSTHVPCLCPHWAAES